MISLRESLIKRNKKYHYIEYRPKTKDELKSLIKEIIEKKGPACDLNFIDTKLITDMSWLFNDSEFNGDISNWDVSGVKNMNGMFNRSYFNGDISKWDVSNVDNMSFMFYDSVFDGDISKWDVSNVKDMSGMFKYSNFNGDISNWDVKNARYHVQAFTDCPLKYQSEKQPKFK